jgi:probable rRNA maturation factor
VNPIRGVAGYDVEVSTGHSEFIRFLPPVEAVARETMAAEGVPTGASAAIVLTSDSVIAEYHARFMSIAGPTDVLSWPSGEDVTAGRPFLGDVMVSCDTARRQAGELGHGWEREVCVLAAHGLLHLLGWDDQTPEARDAMQSRVDSIVDGAVPSGSASEDAYAK